MLHQLNSPPVATLYSSLAFEPPSSSILVLIYFSFLGFWHLHRFFSHFPSQLQSSAPLHLPLTPPSPLASLLFYLPLGKILTSQYIFLETSFFLKFCKSLITSWYFSVFCITFLAPCPFFCPLRKSSFLSLFSANSPLLCPFSDPWVFPSSTPALSFALSLPLPFPLSLFFHCSLL